MGRKLVCLLLALLIALPACAFAANRQEVLDDIGLTVSLPKGMAMKDGDEPGERYIYEKKHKFGIPYLIVGMYSFNHPEKFAGEFTSFMMSGYTGLEVESDWAPVQVAGRDMQKVVYRYAVSGHIVRDTRLTWTLGEHIYMFGAKELPDEGRTLTEQFEALIASATSIYDDTPAPTPEPQAEAEAPQHAEPAPEDAEPTPEPTPEPPRAVIENDTRVVTPDYTLAFPAHWKDMFAVSYTVTETGSRLSVYEKRDYEFMGGGDLFTLILTDAPALKDGVEYIDCGIFLDAAGNSRRLIAELPQGKPYSPGMKETYLIMLQEGSEAVRALVPAEGCTFIPAK